MKKTFSHKPYVSEKSLFSEPCRISRPDPFVRRAAPRRSLRRTAAYCLAAALLFLCALTVRAASVRYAGDVNGDGKVTAADARLVLRTAVGLTYAPDEILPFLDADGDGTVAAEDARLILRTAVGLTKQNTLNSFPVPELYRGDEIPWYAKERAGEFTLSVKQSKTLGGAHVRRSGTQYRWTSSNPEVATVTQNGTVKALKKGFACVYLTNGQNRYYYFVTVRSALQDKIMALQNKYPSGYYWNAHTKSEKYPAVSEIPCTDHQSGGYAYCIGQCAGFASLLSDEVFGKNAPVIEITDKSKIKIGDYLRCLPGHSVFVIDRVEKGEIFEYDLWADQNVPAWDTVLTFAECNWDWHCGIAWGRTAGIADVSLDLNNPYFISYSRYN